MVAWGPIIGAGISAISSLFGGDEKETTTTVDYGAMARSAEKAGFNPLTAIRNGGSAGFTTTTHPALSAEDRFGSMFQTLGNALMSFDARADERALLEDRLMQAQIENLNRSNAAANQSFAMDTPSAAGSSRVGANGRPLGPPDGSPGNPYRATDTYRRADGTTFELPSNFGPDADQAIVVTGGSILDTKEGHTEPAEPGVTFPKLGPVRGFDPQKFAPAVKEWFEPWKGELW